MFAEQFADMAPGKEKKESKDKLIVNPWPHLPKKLIYQIERQPSLCQAIFSWGVTKSWRVKPDKCNSGSIFPWLQLENDHDNKQPHTLSITFKRDCIWYWYRDGFQPEKFHVLGCCQGVLVIKEFSTLGYVMPSPNYVIRSLTEGGWYLPLWNAKDPLIYAASSSKQTFNNKFVVIVLTGIACPSFAFYRMGGETREWIKKDSTIVDPHCSDPNERGNLLQFVNGIWFRDKFYALSLQGTLAVIEDTESDLRITALSKKRTVPGISSKHFREYLVESEGKILLVFLVSTNSIKAVSYVEVYQLNPDKLVWIKKDRIGDVTLFLSRNCCMAVSGSKVGCRQNCICFSGSNGDGWWWVYDMETSSISPGWTDAGTEKSEFWIEDSLPQAFI